MTDIRVAAEQARVALPELLRTLIGCADTYDRLRKLHEMGHGTDHDATRRRFNETVDRSRAALASLEAALAALPGDTIPAVLFDGYAVLSALDERAKTRTSAENVADVLDAVVRLLRHSAATPAVESSQIAGRDGASAAPSACAFDKFMDSYARELIDTPDEEIMDRHPILGPQLDEAIKLTVELRDAEAEQYLALLNRRNDLVRALHSALATPPRQVAHSSQAQGELSVNPVVTNNDRMNEENQNG